MDSTKYMLCNELTDSICELLSKCGEVTGLNNQCTIKYLRNLAINFNSLEELLELKYSLTILHRLGLLELSYNLVCKFDLLCDIYRMKERGELVDRIYTSIKYR